MPVPASPCCRSLPERAPQRGRSSCTACTWFPISLLPRGHSALSAQSRRRSPLSAGRSSLCSHSGCTEAAIPIAVMLLTVRVFDFLLVPAVCGPLGRPSRRPILRLRPRLASRDPPIWSRSFAARLHAVPIAYPTHGLIACEAVPAACGRARPSDRVQACGGSPRRHRCCRLGACAQCHG